MRGQQPDVAASSTSCLAAHSDGTVPSGESCGSLVSSSSAHEAIMDWPVVGREAPVVPSPSTWTPSTATAPWGTPSLPPESEVSQPMDADLYWDGQDKPRTPSPMSTTSQPAQATPLADVDMSGGSGGGGGDGGGWDDGGGLSSVGGGSRSLQGVGATAVDQLHGCSTLDGVAPHFAYRDHIEVESAQLDSQPDRIIPSNGMSAEPYEFVFNATDDFFVDLNSVAMFVLLQVTKADGTALAAADADVWPVDNLLSSLWKSVEVKFNHLAVHPETSSQHAYRAQMEYLLSIENTTNNSYRTAWFGQSEDDRKARFKKRQAGLIDLCGPIALDCLRTTTHLAPGNTMTLTFHRSKDAFTLIRASTSTEAFKINIKDIHLRCNRIRLAPLMRQRVLAGLTGGQNYRLSHTVVNDYPVSAGNKTVSIRLHQGGTLPNMVVVGMVATEAHNGSYGTDPFKFQHFNLDRIYLRVNGIRHPQDPLTPNFANHEYSRELLHLYQNTGKFRVNGGNSITEADFISRSFLVPFDLTPDQCNNAHAHASKTGGMELELSFSSALAAGITVVVLSVSNQVMQLNGLKSPPVTAIY